MKKAMKDDARCAMRPAAVPLDRIAAAAWNVHGDANDDAALAGLAGSMRANGLIQRVTLRRKEDADGEEYEVVDGHRRVEAARRLGWAEIAADVVEADDRAAQLMTATANVQRAANDPLLESALVGRLRDEGMSYAGIAAAMGQGERHVARRARLASLTERWRVWFAETGASAEDAALMEEVARHEPPMQDAVFARYGVAREERLDLDAVKGWFEDEMRALDPEETPFDVSACGRCPNNTATHGVLFPELEDGCGRCQDGACFARKWNAAVDAEVALLREEGVAVLSAKDRWSVPKYWSSTPRRELKNTVPYLCVDGGLERLVWTEPDEPAAAPAKTAEEREAERRAKAARKAWKANRASAIGKIRAAVRGDAAGLSARLVASAGFVEAVRERYERMLGTYVPEDEALVIRRAFTAEELGLTAEEDEALDADDPMRAEG